MCSFSVSTAQERRYSRECVPLVASQSRAPILTRGARPRLAQTILERIKAEYNNGGEGFDADKVTPTVGLNIARARANGLRLMFWDLGGQRGLRSIWDKYYLEAHGLVFVVDSTDQARLDEAGEELAKVMDHGEMDGVPVLLLANKQDVDDAVPAADVTGRMAVAHMDDATRQVRVQAVSATEGMGIDEGLEWLCETMRETERFRKAS